MMSLNLNCLSQRLGASLLLLAIGLSPGASPWVWGADQGRPSAFTLDEVSSIVTESAREGLLDDGLLGRIRDGDLVTIDAAAGILDVEPAGEPLEDRAPESPDLSASHRGMGRDLFAAFRHQVGRAEEGASIFEEVR